MDAELLKEFEVTGEKSTMVMQVDRRVFNVDKDLTTQGGSAVDVMKNIPGLSVDMDGNVEMRGSQPADPDRWPTHSHGAGPDSRRWTSSAWN